MVGIYKITNKVNGKCYIGQSKSIPNRWRQHITDLNNGNHHCFKLQDDYDEYGIVNFSFEVLEICEDENELTRLEQVYMNKYSPKLYNSKRAISSNHIRRNNIISRNFFIPKEDLIFDSINSQRIFFIVIDKILKTNQRYTELSVKEFVNRMDINGNSMYERFGDFAKELSNIKIGSVKIFEYCDYDNYAICVNISNKVMNLIKSSKNNSHFNNITVNEILELKTVKTLPIITKLNASNQISVSIDELKSLLKIENSYNNYSEFKRNVLNKIMKDLKSIGLKNVVLREIKSGKKIKEIVIENKIL